MSCSTEKSLARSARARAARRRRGATMVEAVVVAPVLVLIFAGVLYVGGSALVQQDVDNRVRACAWQYSWNGCTEVPPGCADVRRVPPSSGDQNVEDALSNGKEAILASNGDEKAAVLGVLTSVLEPFIADAFGLSLDAMESRSLSRPVHFGGGTVVAKAKYHLACNLEKKEAQDVADQAWEIFHP